MERTTASCRETHYTFIGKKFIQILDDTEKGVYMGRIENYRVNAFPAIPLLPPPLFFLRRRGA
jgi:hypothetical protein